MGEWWRKRRSVDVAYVTSYPSHQHALDIFEGEWSSLLPREAGQWKAGVVPLFEDGRIRWANQVSGGIKGLTVLELGPLEGGHSYMLEQLGACSILAIEANPRAYLKCLVVKEIMEMQKVRFLLGDFREFLAQSSQQFDICIASGVLYHMTDPANLIKMIASRCRRLLLWTHYYEAAVVQSRPDLQPLFSKAQVRSDGDLEYTTYRYHYGRKLKTAGFCGGSAPHAHWLAREDLLKLLALAGFDQIVIGQEDRNHHNGPCLLLYAEQTGKA